MSAKLPKKTTAGCRALALTSNKSLKKDEKA